MFITAVCVIFLIKLRWPKSKSLYDIDSFLLSGFETLSSVRKLRNYRIYTLCIRIYDLHERIRTSDFAKQHRLAEDS